MASTLHLISELDFRQSRYAQVADQIDGDLSDIIAQAEAYIQKEIDGSIWSQTYVEYLKPLTPTLFLRNKPVTALTSIETRTSPSGSWTLRSLGDFDIVGGGESGMVTCATSLAGFEVRATYVAGYDPVPADIKAAVFIQTVVFAYLDLEIFGTGDSKKPGILYLQDQVQAIIKNYKRNRNRIL